MGTCIEQILCDFAAEYGYHFDKLCSELNLMTEILYLAEPNFPTKYTTVECADQSTLQAALEELIKTTQEKFRARQGNQERNTAEIPEWLEKNAAKIIDYSKKLNFTAEKAPSKNHYSCAALLGSTAPNMAERFKYLNNILDNEIKIDHLFLLTGTRFVDPIKFYDGPQEYLAEIKTKFNVGKVSEHHLIQDKYETVCEKNKYCSQIPYQLINAEKDEGRATTTDTLKKFHKDFNLQECVEVLYISTAPFIMTQNEIIHKFSQDYYPHKYDVVGAAANLKIDLSEAKIAHYLVMSFAESLYESRDRLVKSRNAQEFHDKIEL